MLNLQQLNKQIAQKVDPWAATTQQLQAQYQQLAYTLQQDQVAQQLLTTQAHLNGFAWCTEPPHTQTQIFPAATYTVCGIDGSQIFPDHHEGISWYLLNTGIFKLQYQHHTSSAHAENNMTLYENTEYVSETYVGYQRTYRELAEALIQAQQEPQAIILVDGMLIPFNEPLLQHTLGSEWRILMQELHSMPYAIVSYVSMPHSTVLASLLQRYAQLQSHSRLLPLLPDALLIPLFIQEGYRSALWFHAIPGSPYTRMWCYARLHGECIRIEFLHKQLDIDHIVSIIADQMIKGHGYPLALAEAHVQAVISATERRYFYTTLRSALAQQNSAIAGSIKAARKRCIPI